jgi:hypothetical protein
MLIPYLTPRAGPTSLRRGRRVRFPVGGSRALFNSLACAQLCRGLALAAVDALSLPSTTSPPPPSRCQPRAAALVVTALAAIALAATALAAAVLAAAAPRAAAACVHLWLPPLLPDTPPDSPPSDTPPLRTPDTPPPNQRAAARRTASRRAVSKRACAAACMAHRHHRVAISRFRVPAVRPSRLGPQRSEPNFFIACGALGVGLGPRSVLKNAS